MKVSTRARINCALILLIFMIASIGPLPITSTVGLYVVIVRPTWFKKLVDDIYLD